MSQASDHQIWDRALNSASQKSAARKCTRQKSAATDQICPRRNEDRAHSCTPGVTTPVPTTPGSRSGMGVSAAHRRPPAGWYTPRRSFTNADTLARSAHWARIPGLFCVAHRRGPIRHRPARARRRRARDPERRRRRDADRYLVRAGRRSVPSRRRRTCVSAQGAVDGQGAAAHRGRRRPGERLSRRAFPDRRPTGVAVLARSADPADPGGIVARSTGQWRRGHGRRPRAGAPRCSRVV